MNAPPALTFAEIAGLEPGLRHLAADIRSAPATSPRCAAWYAAGGFKARLLRLVGWHRAVAPPHPDQDGERLLRSEEAYDAAYRHLYALLLG